ncbi:MAG: response regulator [Deltaproteobacteria bacterium]|nr:response regulator [Deltaproteobacteria bacterium]
MPKRILVVDDEKAIQTLLSELLAHEGYGVTCVASGAEVDAAIKEDIPDLVILDVSLPGEDGIVICARLKNNMATMNVPVILMTAKYDSVDDARAGLNAGADEYVIKPFLNSVMIGNVKHLLGEPHQR